MEETTCTQVQTSETNKIPTETIQPLTDDVLASAGLQKITAFVRAEPSSNAKRKQRFREKSEQQGLKQLNIQLPLQMHQVIKDIAQELQRTDDVTTALQNVLVKGGRPALKFTHERDQPKGWRRLLAKLLGLI